METEVAPLHRQSEATKWCNEIVQQVQGKMSRSTVIMEEQVPSLRKGEVCFEEDGNLMLKVCEHQVSFAFTNNLIHLSHVMQLIRKGGKYLIIYYNLIIMGRNGKCFCIYLRGTRLRNILSLEDKYKFCSSFGDSFQNIIRICTWISRMFT